MHPQFESLTEGNDFIVLNKIVFNTNQIKENIVQRFQHKNLNLNCCSKNKFLKTYFREVNNQGIFNRIEWKFWLKEDVKCDLITFGEVRTLDELQIRVILDFSSKENYQSEDFDLKVLLDFSIQELEVEEAPTIDNIETVYFKNIYEQNTTYFHSSNSEEIYI